MLLQFEFQPIVNPHNECESDTWTNCSIVPPEPKGKKTSPSEVELAQTLADTWERAKHFKEMVIQELNGHELVDAWAVDDERFFLHVTRRGFRIFVQVYFHHTFDLNEPFSLLEIAAFPEDDPYSVAFRHNRLYLVHRTRLVAFETDWQMDPKLQAFNYEMENHHVKDLVTSDPQDAFAIIWDGSTSRLAKIDAQARLRFLSLHNSHWNDGQLHIYGSKMFTVHGGAQLKAHLMDYDTGLVRFEKLFRPMRSFRSVKLYGSAFSEGFATFFYSKEIKTWNWKRVSKFFAVLIPTKDASQKIEVNTQRRVVGFSVLNGTPTFLTDRTVIHVNCRRKSVKIRSIPFPGRWMFPCYKEERVLVLSKLVFIPMKNQFNVYVEHAVYDCVRQRFTGLIKFRSVRVVLTQYGAFQGPPGFISYNGPTTHGRCSSEYSRIQMRNREEGRLPNQSDTEEEEEENAVLAAVRRFCRRISVKLKWETFSLMRWW